MIYWCIGGDGDGDELGIRGLILLIARAFRQGKHVRTPLKPMLE